MNGVEVLLKKSCAYTQAETLVYVKQYMIVSENGDKLLVARLVNKRAERVTGVRLSVTQYDWDGNRLCSELKNVTVADGFGLTDKPFVPQTRIELRADTADVELSVVSADYGNYTYSRVGKTVGVEYNGGADPLDDGAENKKVKSVKSVGKSGIAVARRRLQVPILVVLALLVALALAVGAIYAHLKYFVDHEKTFLYSGVEYAFEDDDRSDGTDIYVVGYHGNRSRIVIPKSIEGHRVVGIRDGAFKGNRSLTSISFEADIPVEQFAFEDCTALKSVDFGKITSIGIGAFRGCTSLKSVTISPRISIIAQEAFSGCTSLDTVTVDESEEPIKIDRRAFGDCTGSMSVDFRRRIDYGHNNGNRNYFGGSDIAMLHLVDFDITDAVNGRNHISSLFGRTRSDSTADVKLRALIIDSLDAIPTEFCYNLPLTSFEVKSLNSTVVGASAFRGCKYLEQFKTPSPVTELGGYAFYDSALKSFDGSAVTVINDYAFALCDKLTAVGLERNTVLTTIGQSAFSGCSALRYVFIPSGIDMFAPSVFMDCTALADIEFATDAKIRSIDDHAFSGCRSLKSFDAPTDELGFIGRNAFSGCSALEGIKLTDALYGIDNFAFANCSALTEFTVPDSVGIVGKGAFAGCDALERLTVPFVGNSTGANGTLAYTFGAENSYSSGATYVPHSLKSVTVTSAPRLDARAFYGCDGIESVFLPSTLTVIGESAFYGCSALKSIELPESVTEIGQRAFYDCSALDVLTLPDSLTRIGVGALAECSGLTELTLPFVGGSEYENTYLSYLFGATDVFYGGASYVPASLKTVTVTRATALGANAFMSCMNIESVKLPDTLRSIGGNAFSEMLSLECLNIPDSVTEIGSGAFYNCYALRELSVPFVGRARLASAGEYSSDYVLTYMFGYAVPRSLKKVTVTDSTVVPQRAFMSCMYLEQIVLDCNVGVIGSDAFLDCYRLYEVFNYSRLSIRKGSAEFGGIAQNALKVHNVRDEDELPNITADDGFRYVSDEDGNWYMLDYALGAANIALPRSVRVGEHAFTEYALWQHLFFSDGMVTSVTIPSSVTAIGEFAFDGCYNLESVVFATDSKITEIRNGTFSYCRMLRDINTPSGLTAIDDNAFYYCSRLKKFTVPSTMQEGSIGSDAFAECTRLFEIYNLSTALDIRPLSTDNGRIAEHARAVHTSPSQAIDSVTVGGVQYMKLGDDGIDWWAVDYYGTDGKLDIKPFTYGGSTVDSIGIYDSAFRNYPNVKAVTVSSAVARISDVFSYCYNLESVTLVGGGANTQMEICDGAFMDCSALKTFRADVALSAVGSNAFSAEGLTSAVFTKRVERVKSHVVSGNRTSPSLSLEFADVGVIESNAFSSLSCIGSVKASGKADSIAERAFYNSNIKTLELADVDSIGAGAFRDCFNLTTAKFGNVGSIGENAFANDNVLTKLTFGSVGVIGDRAFAFCSMLNSVDIRPVGTLKIGDGAFTSCSSLGAFEYGGAISSIGAEAFRNDTNLTRLALGSAEAIGENAFYGCYNLASASFNGNIGNIGASAFYGTRMTSLTFGADVGTIGDRAFYNGYMTDVTFTGNVSSIGSYAFSDCYNLGSVSFNGNLGALGEYSFANCVIRDIVLPDSLTTIPDHAFSNNGELFRVTLPRSLVTIGANAFERCRYIVVVYNRSNTNVRDRFDSPLVVASESGAAQYRYNRLSSGGVSFEFVEVQGEARKKWHLIRVGGYTELLVLPTAFAVDGVDVTKYSVRKYSVGYEASVIVCGAVESIDSGAFTTGSVIYFTGTELEWATVGAGSMLRTVYYYSDCLHGSEAYGTRWRYDDHDRPTREATVFDASEVTVTKQPTCSELGESEATCKHCKRTFKFEIAKTEHSFGANDTCSACGKKRTKVTSANMSTLSVLTNDAEYPFEALATGEIRSTNKAHGSSASLRFTADRAITVTFGIRASSEDSFDVFTVTINGSEHYRVSGQYSVSGITAWLNAGDVLTFTYTKDGGESMYDDCGYITDLAFYYTED